jgi:hypothetical protein
MTEVRDDPYLVPHLRRSDHLGDWDPALPGCTGLAVGPPGLAFVTSLQRLFSQVAINKLVAPTARRDRKAGGMTKERELITSGCPRFSSACVGQRLMTTRYLGCAVEAGGVGELHEAF